MSLEAYANKYVYVIVTKKTGRPALISSHLPFYWNKTVAKKRASNFTASYVKSVKYEDLLKLVNKKK